MHLLPSHLSLECVRRLLFLASLATSAQLLAPVAISSTVAEGNISLACTGGQKVKLVLGAACWQNPHLVVLDEPSNYLDRESLGALSSALSEFGGGVIVISHSKGARSASRALYNRAHSPQICVFRCGLHSLAAVETECTRVRVHESRMLVAQETR